MTFVGPRGLGSPESDNKSMAWSSAYCVRDFNLRDGRAVKAGRRLRREDEKVGRKGAPLRDSVGGAEGRGRASAIELDLGVVCGGVGEVGRAGWHA